MTKYLVKLKHKQIVDQPFARMAAKNRLPTKFPKVTRQKIVDHYITFGRQEMHYL